MSTDCELPIAGFVPAVETGLRHVRIYAPNMQLLKEYWEGAASGEVGVGLPGANVAVGLELTDTGGSSLGLAMEAAIAELELQTGDTLQAMLYLQAPSLVTPKVGYGVDAVLPDNRYLIAQESEATEAGGYQVYGWQRLGPGYWLIDVVRGEQRSDLYNWWHRNYCDLTWCPMYPEEF